MPTKLSMNSVPSFDQSPTSYINASNLTDCSGRAIAGTGLYGYQRCVYYTVLDQTSPGRPIADTSSFSYIEQLDYARGARPAQLTANPPPQPLAYGSQFVDSLYRLYHGSPIKAGTFTVMKQVLTIVNNTTNSTYKIRVNCIKYGDTDVQVFDVTTNGDQSCMSQ